MERESGVSIGTVVMALSLCIIIVNVIIVISSFHFGYGGTKGAKKLTEQYNQDAMEFQYKSFQIRDLEYIIPDNFSIDCSDENFTSLNVSPILWFDSNHSFTSCKFWINGVVMNTIFNTDLRDSEEVGVNLYNVNVRIDHSLRLCCDNYCNSVKFQKIC